MKIWAHRGCSQRYPENTIMSFTKATELSGLTGIETDIQLTKDGQLVVIHDERIDRTTDGIGAVQEYTLHEIQQFHIYAGTEEPERIPSLEEVLDMLIIPMEQGLLLNLELKNSIVAYDGMEEKVLQLISQRGLNEQIVYSSFNAKSIEKIKKINSDAHTAILDIKVSDCLYKKRGGCQADALHPYWKAIDLSAQELQDQTVRVWLSGHLYPERPTGTKLDLEALEKKGVTDVILNEPERYLQYKEDRSRL